MRSARFFLACAVVSVLAACGTDPLAPAAEAAPETSRPNAVLSSQCAGTVVTRTLSDGTTTTECVVEGKQGGSGG